MGDEQEDRRETIDLKQYFTKEIIIITLLYLFLCILAFCVGYYGGWKGAMKIATERCEEYISVNNIWW